MLISLSILDYEPELSAHLYSLEESEAMTAITRIIGTGMIHRVHIDVMRPPMIPHRTAFSIELINQIYNVLHDRIALAAHLMVSNPLQIVNRMNGFIPQNERKDFLIILQRESFSTEDAALRALSLLKEFGYKNGICLNLPTPCKLLTKKIVEAADEILLMTVPMGRGGQKYSEEGTRRIAYFSRMFPNKIIEVDGGITPQTLCEAKKAGAKVAVVGSFITRHEDVTKAVLELKRSSKCTD